MKSIPLLNFSRAYCTIPRYNQRHISHPQVKNFFRKLFFKNQIITKKACHHKLFLGLQIFSHQIPVIDSCFWPLKKTLSRQMRNKVFSKFRYDTKAVFHLKLVWARSLTQRPGHRLLIDKRIQA